MRSERGNISINLQIVNMLFVLAQMGSPNVRVSIPVCVCVCVCRGRARHAPFMLMKASHWRVTGAGRRSLVSSKPFIR